MKIKVGIQSQTLYSRAYKGIDLCQKFHFKCCLHFAVHVIFYALLFGKMEADFPSSERGKLVGKENEGMWRGAGEKRSGEMVCM